MKVLVVGESCLDRFVYCKCNRLCPESPVPVMVEVEVKCNRGMASNVMANLHSLLCDEVYLLTNEEQMVKTRYVEIKSNHMVMRLDENDKVSNTFDINEVDVSKFDGVVVSDYDKGYLSVQDLVDISKSHPVTFLDTKKPLGLWALGFTYIKVNESEWENSVKHGALAINWQDKLIVTLGDKGCDYNGVTYPTKKVKVSDLAGAGDSFLAGLVFRYLQTKDIRVSILFANECASKVVQERGVTTI